jgi:hypothetical protein
MKNYKAGEKISLAQCKKILNTEGKNYSDEEIIKIRDWIYAYTEITMQFLDSKSEEELKELYKTFNDK